MSENNNKDYTFDSVDKLDTLTCQLWVMLIDKLRYTRFISTKELEKLKTCNNLNELEKYFELEKKILAIIFRENPELEKKIKFTKIISIEIKNTEILNLIQEYVSIDYIISNATDFNDENIKSIKLYIQKDSKDRFYISNIEILNNN